ncbi:MAG: ABC transporter substrate-binding protein [Vicinamibacterales bacterium]
MRTRTVILLLLAIIAAPSLLWAQGARRTATIVDIRGRSVTVPVPVSRMLIDDGRYIVALSLIHPDPSSVLSAWPHDINRIGDRAYTQYKAKFPRLDTLPTIASSAGNFALEPALAIKPDVAVFTLNQGPTDDQIRQFTAAGIPVVFIDFFTHPFENLEPSLKILGRLTGRDAEAEAFSAFRRSHLQKIPGGAERAEAARACRLLRGARRHFS